jgi:hypothetical protein
MGPQVGLTSDCGMPVRTSKDGTRVGLFARKAPQPGAARPCAARTAAGDACRNTTTDPTGRCGKHKMAAGATSRSALDEMTPRSLADQDPFAEPEWDAWEHAASAPPAPPLPDFDGWEGEVAKATPKPDQYKTAVPPPPPGLTTGNYGHANDAVRPPDMVDLERLAHLKGKNVVTIDLDGTVYDRENCHPSPKGSKGQFGWSDTCDHVKADVVAEIEQACTDHDAVPVIMSWRGGATDESRRWLSHIGLKHDAIFIPGSEDDCAGLAMHFDKKGYADHTANRKEYGGGQVAFKHATVRVLEERVGAKVVGAFDDNPKVTEALAKHGVAHTRTVENAARAKRDAAKTFSTRSGSTKSWTDAGGRSCASCGEEFDYVNVRPAKGNTRLCGDCEASGAAAPAPKVKSLGRRSRQDRLPTDDEMWAGSSPVPSSPRYHDSDVPF